MDFPVVFYDGDCGFCNRSVQFILDNERGHDIHFCALQAETAKSFFRAHHFPEPDMSTFYFWDGTQLYAKSTAALKVLRFLKPSLSWMRVFLAVPPFIRNGVYDIVAKRRHSLATARCVLPTPDQRSRFIV